MKIADFSVQRPVAISMVIIALVLVGLVALPMLRVDLYPDMELPVALVTTSYEGAAPAEVEKLVTRPLESALATVNNVKEIVSYSQSGVSQVVIRFNWGTDMDQAALDMRDKVDLVRGVLPSEVKSPRVLKLDPNSFPILQYALTGPDIEEVKRVAEDIVKPRLERVSGVASVTVSGGKTREIKVVLDPARLESYGLTVSQVSQLLAAENISGSAGTTVRGSTDLAIRVVGEYKKARDLAGLPLNLPGGGTVRLGDIATIQDDFKKQTQLSYVNGRPSVALDVLKVSGSNTVQVAGRVKERVAQINKEMPPGIKLVMVMDLSKFISDSINNVTRHAVLGGLLAVVVLYLFLRSFRSTLVVALVIPISIIATFSMMYFGGQTINLLSLGGLALGLGSLVDFSVVVLESIYRYRQNGYGVIDAARQGTAEVGNAVFASALAQVVVFLPIVFVQGLAGILFGPLALTVSFSHLAALFAALTLVPMLASRLLRRVAPVDEEPASVPPPSSGRQRIIYWLHLPSWHFTRVFASLSRHYGRLLAWCLGHRKRVVLTALALLVGALALLPLVGMEFMPVMDQGEIQVTIELPPGSQLAETGRIASRVEDIVSDLPETETVFTRLGSGGSFAMLGGGNTDQAMLIVKLKPRVQRKLSTEQVVDLIRGKTARIAGAEITVKVNDTNGGRQGKPISIMVRGDDMETLRQLGAVLQSRVAAIEGTRNVTTNMEKAVPEINVTVDRQRAGLYGLSAGQVLAAVRTAFDGQVVSRLRTGEDEVDIRLMFPAQYRLDPNRLAGLMLNTPTGAKVAVGEVADISVQDAPQTIMRYNQSRLLNVEAEIAGRPLGDVNRDVQALMKGIKLPPGYTYEISGEAQEMQESFGNLFLALLLSVVLVYMVMAFLFESLFYPFVIMFSLPPTIVGVVVGLLLTGYHLSVVALIGLIMLVGIVVNNAIVLVDYINKLRRQGMERNQAIMQAGPVRLRPILMTTLSTVLALLPMAFGGGEGSEGRAPLAVVVAFGLTFSTLITLVLVPVVYTIFDDLGAGIRRRLGGTRAVEQTANTTA
ncbi:efflux RND transporter permease subunit [Desulfurispora thermophila]|uniref:efflux RND transporter permease subunit n=1 Tax=Desulfurispora thermophila TaxID=265470 RepID=UPI0003603E2F|nr:efflux RND transporter permease subunit [Desulfurispora thermophila]